MECHRYCLHVKDNQQTLIGKHYLGPLLFLSHICIGAVLEAEAHLSLPRNFADREICRGEEVKRQVGAKTGLNKGCTQKIVYSRSASWRCPNSASAGQPVILSAKKAVFSFPHFAFCLDFSQSSKAKLKWAYFLHVTDVTLGPF